MVEAVGLTPRSERIIAEIEKLLPVDSPKTQIVEEALERLLEKLVKK